MIFKPYIELIKDLTYKVDTSTGDEIALMNNIEIGHIQGRAKEKEALTYWRKEILKSIMANSSTVLLITACQCERQINLTDKRQLHGYRVPIRTSLKPFADDYFENTFFENTFREFGWAGKYDSMGRKMLIEKI